MFACKYYDYERPHRVVRRTKIPLAPSPKVIVIYLTFSLDAWLSTVSIPVDVERDL